MEYTKDEVLDKLGDCSEDVTTNEVPASLVYAARCHFDTWTDAKESAGLTPQKPSVSKEELISDIRRVAKQCSSSLSCRIYDKRGRYSSDTVKKRFGSWNEGKRNAGLYVNYRGVSRHDLLSDLRRVDKEIKGGLSTREYNRQGKYSVHLFYDRFNSWIEAKELAGCSEENPLRRYSFDETAFRTIDDSETAYWAGLLLADGYIYDHPDCKSTCVSLSLKKEDKAHVQRFKDFLSAENPVVEHGHLAEITITSAELCTNLAEYGIVSGKSQKEQEIPEMDAGLHQHFLRGLWDGDGSLFYRKRDDMLRWNIAGVDSLLKEIRSHLYNELDLPENRIGKKLEFIGSTRVARLFNYTHSDALVFLPRKVRPIRQYRDDSPERSCDELKTSKQLADLLLHD